MSTEKHPEIHLCPQIILGASLLPRLLRIISLLEPYWNFIKTSVIPFNYRHWISFNPTKNMSATTYNLKIIYKFAIPSFKKSL